MYSNHVFWTEFYRGDKTPQYFRKKKHTVMTFELKKHRKRIAET
jgi:hypothetical protein